MAKVTINLSAGLIEVEGSEEFVKDQIQQFQSKMLPTVNDIAGKADRMTKVISPKKTQSSEKKLSQNKRISENYQLDPDLDLWKSETKQGLKEFYAEKNPTNGFECNTVFVYYLKKVVKIDKVNPNHIYTCYKDVGKRYPNALRQNLIDTKRDKGWIDTSDMLDIKLTNSGENHVEHDLPLADNKNTNG